MCFSERSGVGFCQDGFFYFFKQRQFGPMEKRSFLRAPGEKKQEEAGGGKIRRKLFKDRQNLCDTSEKPKP